MSFVAWGAVAWHYIWPALKERRSPEALKPFLLLHGFRFMGLAFVVPGVVSAQLPATNQGYRAVTDQTTYCLTRKRSARCDTGLVVLRKAATLGGWSASRK
jgi:hypothetical protein